MSNVEHNAECSYCNREDTSVRGTPFLADVSRGAKMCYRCWHIAEQASDGQIGAFWHSDMAFAISHEFKELEGEQNVLDGIIEEALNKLPEDMVYAMLAGCEIETNYDPENGAMTLKTKNPVGVVKLNGRVTVYERKNDGE